MPTITITIADHTIEVTGPHAEAVAGAIQESVDKLAHLNGVVSHVVNAAQNDGTWKSLREGILKGMVQFRLKTLH